jgi:hypothetical protein
MNEAKLNAQIEHWEEPGGELIRVIDIHEDSVSRIVKRADLYYLYRYFNLGINPSRVVCSVDLNGVDADAVICHLAEQI